MSIKEMTATASGSYAVYVYRLEEKTGYGYNEVTVMPAASIMKIPVMVAVINKSNTGELKLSDEYTLADEDKRTGAGPVEYLPTGTILTIDELMSYLGKNSDNTAWWVLRQKVGKQAVDDVVSELGMKNSSYEDQMTTAADMTKMWAGLYSGKIIGAEGWNKLAGYLVDSVYEDRIPAGLPVDEVRVIHKVGTLDDVWEDAGIVECQKENLNCKIKPLVIVILNKGINVGEAADVVPEIVKRIWNYEKVRLGAGLPK